MGYSTERLEDYHEIRRRESLVNEYHRRSKPLVDRLVYLAQFKKLIKVEFNKQTNDCEFYYTPDNDEELYLKGELSKLRDWFDQQCS